MYFVNIFLRTVLHLFAYKKLNIMSFTVTEKFDRLILTIINKVVFMDTLLRIYVSETLGNNISNIIVFQLNYTTESSSTS